MKPIYQYDDFRAFLKDAYAEKKAGNPGLTQVGMGEVVGFHSTGYFTQVVKGQMNISLEMAHGFAGFFGLNKREAEFFEALVLFNQAKTHDEKRINYERMISFRKASVKVLDAEQYEVYSNWYNLAVKEILNMYQFKGNYQELADLVQPAITVQQARDAVAILEKVGLIAKDGQGAYSLSNKHLSSHFSKSPAQGNYIANSLEIARKSMDTVPPEERQLSSVTMSISEEAYDEILTELQAFRNRMREIAEKYMEPTRAYQFNFQVYPISKPISRKSNE